MRSMLKRLTALLLTFCTVLPILAACSKQPTYVVDFIVDGETYSTVTAEDKESFILPEPPTKDGHTFVGWYYDKDLWESAFTVEGMPTEAETDELKYTVYAYFTPNTPANNGGDTETEGAVIMPHSYLFQLKEVDATSTKFVDYSTASIVGQTTELTSTPDGVAALKWTANKGATFTLPAEVDLSAAGIIKFSIYSPAATNKTYQIRFNCPEDLKGSNSMAPYFRTSFTVDFTGWKHFELPTDNFNGNYGPTWTRISSVNLDCSGWSLTPDANTTVYFTEISSFERNYEVVMPVGVTDANNDEFYDTITAKHRELLIGTPEGSSAEIYKTRVSNVASSCLKVWKTNSKSFKNTFVDVDTEDTLFGYDMSDRTNVNNVDEQKITSVYTNLLTMTLGYATKGDADTNPYYHDAELLADIKLGLEYCYKNYYGPTVWEDGVYGNWWHWDIGVPLKLTDILVILENELGKELCAKYLKPFDYLNPLPNMTACNKVWITRCILLSAALQHDPIRLLRSEVEVANVFDYVTTGDGFYTDGSFIQHENLAYTGGYGLSMLSTLSEIMYFMHGSRFEWTDPDVTNQYRWVFENFRPCLYNGNFMAAMRGREIIRNTSEASASGTAIVSMIRMQAYAPEGIKKELEALIRHYMLAAKKNYAGNVPLCLVDYALALYENDEIAPADDYLVTRVLSKMDRIVQHNKEYGVCISLSSTRIAKYESINRENQTGWYMGDGMIYIYTDGYDYNGTYFQRTNSYLLPGTTVNSALRLENCPSPNPKNSSAYAGGVELGAYGAAGFILGYDVSKVGPSALGSNNATKGTFLKDSDAKISAKKSYFMFDNEIVCLGSGISDQSGTNVYTVVENRFWNSGDTLKVNGQTVSATASATSVDASTMHFTNMGGYVFLLNDTDKNTISYKKNTNTSSFLEITIGHGKNVSGEAYAYVYLPEATAEQTDAYGENPDVTVIKRNTKCHAVVENSLGMMGCIFYEADTVNNKTGTTAVSSISASDTCAVMVKTNENGETVISVSDPTQLLYAVRLSVTIPATTVVSADSGITATLANGVATIDAVVSGSCGSTFSITLK